ncbi:MAG: hypothetical protein ACK5MM_03010, partial [Planctomyces sp.]
FNSTNSNTTTHAATNQPAAYHLCSSSVRGVADSREKNHALPASGEDAKTRKIAKTQLHRLKHHYSRRN